MPSEVFTAQVALLVRVLPYVAAEACFALKGGTASPRPFAKRFPEVSSQARQTLMEPEFLFVSGTPRSRLKSLQYFGVQSIQPS